MEALIIILELAIILMIYRLRHEVVKGNKDQQEIKTRLHWLRESVNKIHEPSTKANKTKKGK